MATRHRFSAFLTPFLIAALIWPAGASPLGKKTQRSLPLAKLAAKNLSEDEAILHILNRLGFGPRPGDMDRVRKAGLEKYIEQQLNPATIADTAVQARLERYPTLAMSPAKLLEEFPNPAQAARRMGLSPEEYRKQMEEKAPRPEGNRNMQPPRMEDVRGPQRIVGELSLAKLTRAIYSERQLEEMMVDFWFNHFNVFTGKGADRWLLTSY